MTNKLKTSNKIRVFDLKVKKYKYYQVTESLLGESVREREFASLRDIRDNYEKIVLSMDKSFIRSYDGIKQKNIIEFLMEKS